MKQENLSILFFILKNRPLKNGECPILLRVTINGNYEEIRIQRSVEPKLWNQAKGLSKGRDRESIELNDYIKFLDSRLFAIYSDLVAQQAYITPEFLLKKLFSKDEEVRTVLKTFKEHNDEMYSLIGIDYEKITWRRYDVCYRSLQTVIKKVYKKEDITFYEFDRQLIQKLETYLKKEQGLCRNTLVRYMKCVKKITNLALANDWLKKDPFIGLRYSQEETNPVFLTMEELDVIKAKDFNIERLNIVKDTFLFCCFTGLAFKDARCLTPAHLFTDTNGNTWIRKGREKLKRRRTAASVSNVPLMQPALELLEKYKDHPKSIKRGACLPLYSNQKMNDYLKEIAELCGIEKNITTHVARHTFATTIALGNKVSLENVAKMMGHASTRMTQHYARVMDQNILEDMQLAERRITGRNKAAV